MSIGSHRKQVLFFLTAVLLPVIVLVGLTLLMVGQQKELAQKRVADEHRRVAGEIGQALALRLDRIVRQETSALQGRTHQLSRREYVNPEAVLIARIEDSRLVLPWESGREPGSPSSSERDTRFARRLSRAEDAEFSLKDYSLAAERYRLAASVARTPTQEGYARLQLARSLLKRDRVQESLSEYEAVLSLSPDVVDEYGVPLALYAVAPLLEAGSGHARSVARIGRQLRSGAWLSPGGAYLMKDLLEKIIDSAPVSAAAFFAGGAAQELLEVTRLIQVMEQALSLEEDLPRLGLEPLNGPSSGNGEPLWVSYGRKPWLVGRSPDRVDGKDLLFAIDFAALSSAISSEMALSGISPKDVTLMIGDLPDGASLGPAFQGIGIVFGPGVEEARSKQGALQRLYYYLALAIVLGVTLFGAYLLWRDVRREVLTAEMRSQFVSSVSHELKTPLTSIRMFAETLRLGRTKDPSVQAEYLGTIVNESERLSRLLNNVLDFSRIERGTRTYHTAPVSLAEIVRTAARAMEYPLKQQGFALDVRVDDGLPPVRVDRDAIEQAVLNLLGNAMKYSGDSRRIDLNAHREGAMAVIQVVDRGIGIAPKDRTLIFEKFYRVPSLENRSLPGTGLGLPLVEHIARAHNGSVRVDSVPGKGSTFSILLPLEAEP